MIKNRRIGREGPDRNKNQGPLEVSLRPERGVVGSETPRRARGVWRPGWLASQTEKKEDQKELWREPKRESRVPASKEGVPPQGRRTSGLPSAETEPCSTPSVGGTKALDSGAYNGGGARDIVKGVGTAMLGAVSIPPLPSPGPGKSEWQGSPPDGDSRVGAGWWGWREPSRC